PPTCSTSPRRSPGPARARSGLVPAARGRTSQAGMSDAASSCPAGPAGGHGPDRPGDPGSGAAGPGGLGDKGGAPAMRWFQFVEAEVNSRCNRKCQYCPNSILPEPDVPKLMSDAVFERLLAELQRIDYAGRLSYHLFGEPLLRRALERLAQRATPPPPT